MIEPCHELKCRNIVEKPPYIRYNLLQVCTLYIVKTVEILFWNNFYNFPSNHMSLVFITVGGFTVSPYLDQYALESMVCCHRDDSGRVARKPVVVIHSHSYSVVHHENKSV